MTPRWALAVSLVLAALAAAPGLAVAQLTPPVDAPVIDHYRPPAHIGAPGNRGWEYQVEPGTPVRASGAGVVAFAGQVGAGLHVSVDHPSGLRTSYSFLGSVAVVAGQAVTSQTVVGTSGDSFHFGVRRDGQYIDPATVLASSGGAGVRLVPVRARGTAPTSGASISERPQYTLGLAHPWVM